MNERLKQLRKALHLTQKAFAEKIGAKQNTIATYEMGRNNPSDPVIRSICVAFNVNEEWLRTGNGNMFLTPAAFSLDEYAVANSLTDRELLIIRGFMELEPSVRSAIYNIFKNAFSPDRGAYDNAPASSQELEKIFPPIGDDDADANIG